MKGENKKNYYSIIAFCIICCILVRIPSVMSFLFSASGYVLLDRKTYTIFDLGSAQA